MLPGCALEKVAADGGAVVTNGSPESGGGLPPRLETGRAYWARVWNYLLGGEDNFAADREAVDMLLQIYPGFIGIAREQHRFLVRAVRYLAGQARVRQFLHIGAGLPAAVGTHQIAAQSRVVYVDSDPLVLVRAQALPPGGPGRRASYIEADVRDTGEILKQAACMLDFGQPVALVMLSIIGQMPDSAQPRSILAAC